MSLLFLSATLGFTSPSWTSSLKSDAPQVSGHAASVDGLGRVLLFGGLTGSAGSPCTSAIWAFDDAGWQLLKSRNGDGPGQRMYMASAVHGSALYVVGGWDPGAPGSGGDFKDDVWKLDINDMEWKQLSPMPCGPVSRHTACTVGDMVVIQTFRGTFVLDPATGETREQPTSGDGPLGLSMCAAAPLGESSMLIFGGSTKTQEMVADVHVLDTSSWTWRKLVASKDGRAPTPRASSCACAADGTSCLVFGGAGISGGYDGGAGLVAFDETWRVRVDGDEAIWDVVDTAGEIPTARVAASLNALPSGKFLLQGGWNPSSKETFTTPFFLDTSSST